MRMKAMPLLLTTATCVVLLAGEFAEAQHKSYRLFMGANSPAAQKRPAIGQGEWATFWVAFRTAVRKQDRAALKSMMSSEFEWAGDGNVGPDQGLSNLDQGLASWQKVIRSVNRGVIDCRVGCGNAKGRPARRTIGPEYLVFELRAGGWKWVRLLGD